MSKIAVVYNPVSGARILGDLRTKIKKILTDKGFILTWIETKPGFHQDLQELLNHQFHRIFVVGGDGTFASVANFCLQHQISTPLAIIPKGCANLLALSQHLPLFSVKKAIDIGLNRKITKIDAMKINQNFYGFTGAGCGFDVRILKHATRAIKQKFGLISYVIGFFKHFFTHPSETFNLTINDQEIQITAKSIMVFNALPFSELKFAQILLKHKIKPDDGILNVIAFNPRFPWSIIKIDKKQAFTGQRIIIKSAYQETFQVDGKVFEGQQLKIEIMPKVIEIVC
ncbi:MAG: hypothetical protein UR28_C0015G0025 [Candidatus Peregrinibacteria bacterium GW2011_GWF2_33_10]|nr:MAG: hypothetical protein UR28_C0015G0025 [Candidatus Peregrinibacteria bacterium GW2011_GWF2_33_10]OGJ44977.1 MAG: hypothetical protein A2263_02850 [Candidatus Peregrinibacteria bacterium RIFOXYA2_FULL_33_21]OGJ47451.1 MAG: hypothetical protein A2272_04265 [Candidatus Peregrinibacteria bacterium RIFOXYA12_FULL_33_12]OGJ50720.1 MAG: hypothetical protein A2307_03665 [Candidatus Peregrinibacteria bacterium RIFOXYB2_FULL_33_20]